MLDLSDETLMAQLTPPGTYAAILTAARVIGSKSEYISFSWELNIAERTVRTVIEDFVKFNVGPGEDPSQAAEGRARLKAIFDAHGIEPIFDNEADLIRKIVGVEMLEEANVFIKHQPGRVQQ